MPQDRSITTANVFIRSHKGNVKGRKIYLFIVSYKDPTPSAGVKTISNLPEPLTTTSWALY